MPNAYKPFGARATSSTPNRFVSSRLILTGAYIFILSVILAISLSATQSIFFNRVRHRFDKIEWTGVIIGGELRIKPIVSDVRRDMMESLTTVNLFLLIIAGIASYWFAGMTLRPIERAYNEQKRFLSYASHELRTPLAILKTSLEHEKSLTGDDKDKSRLESHLEEVNRMSALVDNLLVLSKLEDAKERTTRKPASVAKTVEDSVSRLKGVAQKQRIALTSEPIDESLFILEPRPGLLTQALTNLIQNAILYNKPEGSVTLSATAGRKSIVITVKDTGIGIAKKDLPSIFDRFYRADESHNRATGGSGLGLAIVSESVYALNGEITVESEVGKGTIFTIILPIHKPS